MVEFQKDKIWLSFNDMEMRTIKFSLNKTFETSEHGPTKRVILKILEGLKDIPDVYGH